MSTDNGGVKGHALLRMIGPDGELKWERRVENLITSIGDRYYAQRASGAGTAPGQITGMKLGTGSAATAKSGAGSALGTYLTGSHRAIDGGFPTYAATADSPPKQRIQFKTSYPAGVATHAAITEVVLVNDTLVDATSPEANTVARILTNPGAPATGISKGSGDTLEVTWNHDHRAA